MQFLIKETNTIHQQCRSRSEAVKEVRKQCLLVVNGKNLVCSSFQT